MIIFTKLVSSKFISSILIHAIFVLFIITISYSIYHLLGFLNIIPLKDKTIHKKKIIISCVLLSIYTGLALYLYLI